MNILLINGSPKVKDSASEVILRELEGYLEGHTISYCPLPANKPLNESQLQMLTGQDALVIAFPLYVDSIPSHFLRALMEIEGYLHKNPTKIVVYGIVNCGFYEGRQNHLALDMLKNWCVKSGISWGRGLGIGGGGMLVGLRSVPVGQGLRKIPSAALQELAKNVEQKQTGDDVFISPAIPRFIYQIGGHMGWRKQIKQNGLTTKDLFRQK